MNNDRPAPKNVAGITCDQVLEKLSDYVDEVLDVPTRQIIDLHLEGCDWCRRFGGEFGEMLDALKALGDD